MSLEKNNLNVKHSIHQAGNCASTVDTKIKDWLVAYIPKRLRNRFPDFAKCNKDSRPNVLCQIHIRGHPGGRRVEGVGMPGKTMSK